MVNDMNIRFILAALCVLVYCGCKNPKTARPTISVEASESVVEEAPVVKDSIDILIEQRAKEVFNSTIFSGLRFGDSRRKVEKVLKNKLISRSVYGTEIPIQVPYDDKVKEVIVRDYDAKYYNEQLASLVLYANEASLMEALSGQYTNKYGQTKGYDWCFSNCEIKIEKVERVEDRPDFISNYLTYTPMYFDSYRGGNTTRLTKQPYFLRITYKNYDLLHSIERQAEINDSLAFVKRMKEEQIEKERARKLATEVPTNI